MGRRKTGHKLDNLILDYMKKHRRVTTGELSMELGYGRNYIVERLNALVEQGKVKRVVRGLYELVEDCGDEVKTKGA